MGFALRDKTFLEQPFVKLFEKFIRSRKLTDRIFDIYSAPEIQECNKAYCISVSDGSTLYIDGSNLTSENITTGLAILYGYGFVKPNYSLPVLSGTPYFPGEKFAKDLAAEIWDARIHIDWMRNYRGHDGHNESKDLEFCMLLAEGKTDEARKKHMKDCMEARDTPHYVQPSDFVNYLEHENPILKEIFDDQASIAGRHFKKNFRLAQAHCDYQSEIMGKGVQLEEHRIVKYWNRSTFTDFLIARDIQEKKWREWKESNIAFCKYWTTKFGSLNKDWVLPNT